MKPKWGGISKYMGLNNFKKKKKKKKTLAFFLFSYMCIYW